MCTLSIGHLDDDAVVFTVRAILAVDHPLTGQVGEGKPRSCRHATAAVQHPAIDWLGQEGEVQLALWCLEV